MCLDPCCELNWLRCLRRKAGSEEEFDVLASFADAKEVHGL